MPKTSTTLIKLWNRWRLWLIRNVLNPGLVKNQQLLAQSVALASLFFLVQTMLVCMSLVAVISVPEQPQWPFLVTFVYFFVVMALLRYRDNLKLVNMLTGLYLFSLFSILFLTSGGLYSDNAFWLAAVPLFMFYFTSIRNGLFWSGIILLFLSGVFVLDKTGWYPISYPLEAGVDYYFWSIFFLFLTIFASIYYGAYGKEKVIRLLQFSQRETADKKKKLEQSNRELETFAYSAAHEIREPLRMIAGYSGLLKEQLDGKLNEEQEEFMLYILNGADQLNQMLDSMLFYAKVQKPNIENGVLVDLNDVFFVAMHQLKSKIEETEAVICSSRLPQVPGDFFAFVRLFQNLISNALKFSKPGKSPCLEVIAETRETECIVQFIDKGIGLEKAEFDRIFELFQRLPQPRQIPGSGIGLALCKRMVAKLGGSIWLESEVGVGTTFFVALPMGTHPLTDNHFLSS